MEHPIPTSRRVVHRRPRRRERERVTSSMSSARRLTLSRRPEPGGRARGARRRPGRRRRRHVYPLASLRQGGDGVLPRQQPGGRGPPRVRRRRLGEAAQAVQPGVSARRRGDVRERHGSRGRRAHRRAVATTARRREYTRHVEPPLPLRVSPTRLRPSSLFCVFPSRTLTSKDARDDVYAMTPDGLYT